MAIGFSVKHPAAEVLLFWVAMGPAAQVTLGDPGVPFAGELQKTIKKPMGIFYKGDSLHDPPGGFPKISFFFP